VPESRFVVADVFLRFDHVTGTAEVVHGDGDEIAATLARPVTVSDEPAVPGATTRTPDQAEHERRVRRAQELIRQGDAFQIVLSQRAERPTTASALAVYRALRRINPSPYLFLLELGDLALVGSSPETHVKVEGRRASLNPIAGTTERGPGDAERLLASEKDRAEHVMLVDLGRNDLSRVCVPGSVTVERFLEPERFSHVTHLVSEVAGELQDAIDQSVVVATARVRLDRDAHDLERVQVAEIGGGAIAQRGWAVTALPLHRGWYGLVVRGSAGATRLIALPPSFPLTPWRMVRRAADGMWQAEATGRGGRGWSAHDLLDALGEGPYTST